MYAQKEVVRGGAPPQKNNLIGTVARGWTLIGPFKMDTKALFIAACSKTLASSLSALQSANRRYNQADHLKNSKTSSNFSLKNFNTWIRKNAKQTS